MTFGRMWALNLWRKKKADVKALETRRITWLSIGSNHLSVMLVSLRTVTTPNAPSRYLQSFHVKQRNRGHVGGVKYSFGN